MPQVRPTRKRSYGINCTVENQQETLYACPPNCASEMSLLFLSNANGNTTVSVTWLRNDQGIGDQTIHILGSKNMTAGEYVQFSNATIVMQPGESITVTPTGNSTPLIDVICTVEESFLPTS